MPLLTARTVMVWRVFISSASLVWERYVLNWEYSGWLERTSVMLVNVMVGERSRRETRERWVMSVTGLSASHCLNNNISDQLQC